MRKRPANRAPTAGKPARLREALLLVTLALLVSLIFWATIGVNWTGQLGGLFGHYLSRRLPGLAAAVVLFLAAAALTIAYRVRRKRATRPPASAEAPPDPSATGAMDGLAYALLGLLVGTILFGELRENLSFIFGPYLAVHHPLLATIAGLAAASLTLVWLIWLADRRKRAPDAGMAADPAVAGMRRLFGHYFTILAVTFGLGVVLLWSFRAVNALIDAWVLFYPWVAIALALAVLGVLVDSTRQYFGAEQRPPVWKVFGEAGQNALLILALCALAVLVLFWNYQGYIDSTSVFAQVSLATRVAFFAMPALFTGIVLATLLLYTRVGRRPQVFISFEHTREETAVALAKALSDAGLAVQRISFRDDYEHDPLLQAIQENIRHCDAVVCLPGARPSFVENEILVASTLRKFIVFLVGEAEPRLPNTAYYGYPVFRLEKVTRLGFKPVAELILLVAGNWRASLRYFLDSWTRLFDEGRTLLAVIAVFVGGTYLIGGVLAALPGSGTDPWRFVTRFHRAYIDMLGNWTPFWIWLNLFLIGCVLAIANQVHTRNVLRQKTLTGHLTLKILRKRLGGGKKTRSLLACLWGRPPPAEHELEARAP